MTSAAVRLDGADDILVGCVENGPWVLIEDPALRELVSRYVADVVYEVAEAVGLNEARNAALQLRGDRRLPTTLTSPVVPTPGDWRVLVAAHEHPDRDEWVDQQAQNEADNGGLVLGDYLGREDVFGPRRLPELCCHVFTATKTGTTRD